MYHEIIINGDVLFSRHCEAMTKLLLTMISSLKGIRKSHVYFMCACNNHSSGLHLLRDPKFNNIFIMSVTVGPEV